MLAIIGHPRRMNLQDEEAAAFANAGIDLPVHIFVYRHLLLTKKDRLITSESCSKATKRNNSCVVYESTARRSGVTCGILRKLVMLKDENETEVYYVLLHTLRPASFELCYDSVTDAKLGDHIVAFHPPRLVYYSTFFIISNHSYHISLLYLCRDGDFEVVAVERISDKAVLLEVQSELNYVFVSLFPNYSEVE